MTYYDSGDLNHYISKEFYNISWLSKLSKLKLIAAGLRNIHDAKIIHRDLHSRNILMDMDNLPKISDFGLSKSATASTDDDDKIFGVIPYVAPEIFQEKKIYFGFRHI